MALAVDTEESRAIHGDITDVVISTMSIPIPGKADVGQRLSVRWSTPGSSSGLFRGTDKRAYVLIEGLREIGEFDSGAALGVQGEELDLLIDTLVRARDELAA